jgi:hypothetical protein
MTDKDYDELSTKREMVRLLAKDATAEQLDAAIYTCMDNRLNDEERRTVLIQTIYTSWYERLTKRPHAPGVDFAVQWQDVERMFRDVLAMVGAPRSSSAPTSSDEKSESQSMTARIARLPVAVPEPPPDPVPQDERTESVDESTTLEHVHRALDESPPPLTSSEEKWGPALPMRARLSLDGARDRPMR